jgi:anti-sigma factor RsiW
MTENRITRIRIQVNIDLVKHPFRATCAETSASLSEHLDGELRGYRRWRVLRHLATCEHCRAVLRSLRETVENLRALGRNDPESQPSLADSVIDRIATEQ